MQNPQRVVIDTNVWLSALYFAGKPAQIINLVEEEKVTSVTSSFILDEIQEKLVSKFDTPRAYANGTVSYIESISEKVSIEAATFNIRDLDDNPIIETANKGECRFIITGDKDLLTFGRYRSIHVVTPSEFLEKHE